MNLDFDVLIVGAGPAGAACARTLRDADLRVGIIEREQLPRIKSCCGLLSTRALTALGQIFGTIPDALIQSEVTSMFSGSMKTFIHVGEYPMKVVRRDAFDYWLVEQCAATVLEKTRYVDHIVNDRGIEVRVARERRQKSVTCRYLIAADGGASSIRRRLQPTYLKKYVLINHQRVYRCKESNLGDYFYAVIRKRYADAYGYFFHIGNELKIGVNYLPENKQKDYFELLFKKIDERFCIKPMELLRVENVVFNYAPKEDRYFFGDRNVLVVGEASGLIYDFGEGIPSALISGAIAGEAVREKRDGDRRTLLEIYENAVDDEKQLSMEKFRHVLPVRRGDDAK